MRFKNKTIKMVDNLIKIPDWHQFVNSKISKRFDQHSRKMVVGKSLGVTCGDTDNIQTNNEQ